MIFIHLIKNFIKNFALFFKHWYLDGFYLVYEKISGIIYGLEKQLALKLNLHFIFQPLYQEYNIYGYVMGFLFRSLRIIFGFLLYLLIVLVGLASYLIWSFVPLFILYKIITSANFNL